MKVFRTRVISFAAIVIWKDQAIEEQCAEASERRTNIVTNKTQIYRVYDKWGAIDAINTKQLRVRVTATNVYFTRDNTLHVQYVCNCRRLAPDNRARDWPACDIFLILAKEREIYRVNLSLNRPKNRSLSKCIKRTRTCDCDRGICGQCDPVPRWRVWMWWERARDPYSAPEETGAWLSADESKSTKHSASQLTSPAKISLRFQR